MKRSIRIPIALLALALVAVGAAIGRLSLAAHLRAGFAKLAEERTQKPETGAAALLQETANDAQGERIGEALLGAGCVLLIVSAAGATRASPALAATACLVGVLGTAFAVKYPSATLPGIQAVSPPSSEWPYGAVPEDRSVWNAFIIIKGEEDKRAWSGAFNESTRELGPDALADAVARHLKKGSESVRPVHLWYDPRCPNDTVRLFEDALLKAIGPLGLTLESERLCDPADFSAKKRQLHEQALSVYRDTAIYASLARFAWAIALGMLVWRADVRSRGARGTSLLAGGQLLIALAQVVALPVAFYVGMLPEKVYFKNPFARLGENAAPYEILLCVSAGMLALGAAIKTVGEWLVPELPPEKSGSGWAAQSFAARMQERKARKGAPEPAPPPHHVPETSPPAAELTAQPLGGVVGNPPSSPSPSLSEADAKTPEEAGPGATGGESKSV